MMPGRFSTSRLFVLLLVCPAAVLADSLGTQVSSIRCDSMVISVGDPSYRLIDSCGEPDFRQLISVRELADRVSIGERPVRLDLQDREQVITEQWVYKPGRGRLIREIYITGGTVTRIELAQRQ